MAKQTTKEIPTKQVSVAPSNGVISAVRAVKPANPKDFSKKDLMQVLRLMMISRRTDEKHLTILKQGKSFFHIGVSGHEAIQIAVAMNMKSGHDWAYTYYRDMALTYTLGMTTREYFLAAMAKDSDPASGGRQMPGHYGGKRLNMPTQSSPTGTQYLQAVGCALASRRLKEDSITYVASGEGATSEGEFFEAVNWASREKLPVLFCVQDNGYAISVPKSEQTGARTVGDLVAGFPNLLRYEIDGTDFFESYAAAREVVQAMREGKGVGFILAHCVRLLPHSSSDSDKKYRPEKELVDDRKRDPLTKFCATLIDAGITTEKEITALRESVHQEIDDAVDWAETQADPDPSTALRYNFSDTPLVITPREPKHIAESIVMVDAINHALREEMKHNPKMVVFGEDVADPKGGVFTVTRGLTTAFGRDRVFNSPLAEASIAGVAIGLATRGFKPVVEIQFGDYIWPAFMQLRDELVTMRYRSNNNFSCPMVLRVAVGGYIHGGLYHSQNIEAFFAHMPGLHIVYPSNAADAKGLLKTACRIDDPVLYCEHKGLYRAPSAATFEPDEDYLIPFGKARIAREGSDITLVTYGQMVAWSLDAARRIHEESGKEVEVIDLRTILPYDEDAVHASIKKTGRVVIVHEDTLTAGFGAEIAARIAKSAFEHLDAPVERVAAADSSIPYQQDLEEVILPTPEKIRAAVESVLAY